MAFENGYVLSFPPHLQFSDDELFQFCQQNPDLNIERDNNQNIIIMSLTGSLSGAYTSCILIELGIWNKSSKLGHVFDSSTGFTLPDGSMRSPDVSWVSNKQWDALSPDQKRKFAPVCPEFAVEVKSPGDKLEELKKKMQSYLSNGALLGWLFDVDNETVWVYSPGQEVSVIYGYNKNLKADDTLPGFEMDLRLLKEKQK